MKRAAYELEKRGLRNHAPASHPRGLRISTYPHGVSRRLGRGGIRDRGNQSAGEHRAVHQKQLLTYLKAGDKRLGLLINFNVA